METMKNRKHKNEWKLWKIESTKMYGNYGKWLKYGYNIAKWLIVWKPASICVLIKKKIYIFFICIQVSRCIYKGIWPNIYIFSSRITVKLNIQRKI